MMKNSRRAGLAASALVAAFGLSGCGLGTSAGLAPSGKLAGPVAGINLNGADIAVGSKQFTEQLILGKMSVILLKSAGANVQDFTTIPGSSAARQAMLQNQIQFMWDYTGTGWISYLGNTNPIKGSQAQYVAVRDADAKNGITWMTPSSANDTYDFAGTQAKMAKLGVKKLSDLAKVPVKERTLCVASEFASRNDGLQPMLKAYGIPLGSGVPKNQIKTIDAGAIYSAIKQGLCNFGEVFTTDGRIPAFKLKALEDDKEFFPHYNISPTVRTSTLKKHPEIEKLMAVMAQRLNNDELSALNAKVDVDGEEPAKVAQDWLKKQGLIK